MIIYMPMGKNKCEIRTNMEKQIKSINSDNFKKACVMILDKKFNKNGPLFSKTHLNAMC